jgi:hypothetical protein
MTKNITGELKMYLLTLKDTEEKKKLVNSLNKISKHKFDILFERSKNSYNVFILDKLKAEVGYFTISVNEKFTLMMNIFVDDEYFDGNLRKIGLSRLLICSMIYVLKDNVRKDQLLFIDVDASYENKKSFWDHIGMTYCRFDKESRVGIRKTSLDGSGCEKVITFSDLSKWATGVPMGDNQIVANNF